jgi:4-amino-4-deoxy-L-arabinose transferase-like glycosyltransferase
LELQGEIIDSMTAYRFWDAGYSIVPYDPANPPHVLDDIWPGYAHETHQQPLYYQIAALIIRAGGPRDVAAQLMLVRYFSALLGAGVVLFAWWSARTLFPQSLGLPLLIALFVALLPMHTFLNANANNDNLTSFFGAVQLVLSARALRYGLRWREVALMVIVTGLALITKRTGFIAPVILAVTLLAASWDSIVRVLKGRRARPFIAFAAGAAVLVIAGCGLIARLAGPAMMRVWSGFFHLPRDVIDLLLNGSYAQALIHTPYPYYGKTIFQSFWARFGWLNITLSDRWYLLLAGICALAVLGLSIHFVRALRGRSGLEPYQSRTLVVFVVIAVLGVVLIIGKEVLFLSYRTGVLPQGRYLFPIVIVLATLLVVGLRELTPGRLRTAAGLASAAALLVFDLICVFGYIIPHYHG